MIRPARRRSEMGRFRLAAWGAVGLVAFLVITVTTTVYGTGALSGHPEVTAEVAADTIGVPSRAPVEYKGVLVGTVTKVETTKTTSVLTMRINERHAESVSTRARVRVLPRTLFGDLFVELVPAEEAGEPISDGDELRPDESEEAVQLYDAFERLTTLLEEIEPAKISTALGALSSFLEGRGERFGTMLDQLHEMTDDTDDLIALIDDGMEAVTTLSEQAVEATPDGIRALRNAVQISRTIVEERRTIHQLLTSGSTLAGEGSRLARSDNVDRFVELVRTADPITDELVADPGALPRTVHSVRELLEAAPPTFKEGPWFRIRANLTTEEPYPYTAEDCPRYPGQDGPNCSGAEQDERAGEQEAQRERYGGTSGPVGSDAEKETLNELLEAVPQDMRAARDSEAEGAVGVLLGPLVRGSQVVVP
ncbi:MCE family protein [Haloechinothrix sp. YIM 98757]|uniref:MCE family protein n=1 Tax=Haloechinothrix aidingensis TaxID=2752311 RepID=A0A838ADF8_9PSEU|nr:MCE family protein [Haloechinothrix aidingensis]MBA0127334.1 MCE family protein [Haloechinothrix aidingensis]